MSGPVSTRAVHLFRQLRRRVGRRLDQEVAERHHQAQVEPFLPAQSAKRLRRLHRSPASGLRAVGRYHDLDRRRARFTWRFVAQPNRATRYAALDGPRWTFRALLFLRGTFVVPPEARDTTT
jgi:hypothetical protein